MTSPGGAVVGRVSVRVLPDTSGFRAKLEAELRKINPEVKVRIVPDLDTERLRAQLAALDLRDINMRVDVDGVALAIAELTALEQIVDRLDGRNIRIRIDVDGLAEAIAQLAALEGILNGLRASLGRLNVGGGGGGAGVGSILSTLGAVIAIAPLLVYAGAGITAAWGAVSTAIAAVPGALALVAVPALAIVAGFDGIKDAAQQLKPELDNLKQGLNDVFREGLTPVFASLKPLFPLLKSGLGEVAESIVVVIRGLASMVTTADGFTLLRNIFTNTAVALRLMTPGIMDMADAFLLLAGRSSLFDALTNTVNRFGAAWREQLVDNINNGSLDAAFRGLQDVLLATTEGLVSFVHNGIEVFAAAAPGVASLITDLTGFFNRFDWTSLGASVGGVFQGLGDAIKNVPQGTINAISTAFADLSRTFNDPQFKGNIQSIIEGVPAAVRALGDLSFAASQIGAGISQGLQALDPLSQKLKDIQKDFSDFGTWLSQQEWWKPPADDPIHNWFTDLVKAGDKFFGTTRNWPGEAQQAGQGTGQGLADGINGSKPLVDRAAESLGSTIPTTVQQNLGQVPGIAQTALAPLPNTAQQIFAQLQPAIQNAFAGVVTTAQLGFASVAAAVALGGPQMIAAITTAFVGTDVAVTTAFGLMAIKAQEGLALVAAAIGTGFAATILPAFDTAFLGVGEKFVALGVQMAAKMTEGLALVRQAALTGTLGIDDVFLKSQQVWTSFIQVGTGLMVTYMQTGMQQLLDTVNQYLVAIAGLFLQWSFSIVTLVLTMTTGMNDALATGMATAQATVDTGVAAMVASLNGAVEQFRAAGSNMGAALAEGLRSRQGEVEAAAAALANAAAAAVRAAAVIRSPSKVFDYLGQMVGKGFAGGMSRTLGLIKTVSVGMVQAVSGALSKVIDSDSALADFANRAPEIDKRTSVYASGASLSIDDNNLSSVGDKVADALAGWSVEIDQQGIAKLVNRQNLRDRRR